MLHQELGPHGWSQWPGAFTDRGLIPCRGKQADAGSLECSSGPRSPGQSGHCSLPQCPQTHTRTSAVQRPIDGLEGHANTELQTTFGVMAKPAGGQLQGTQTHRACSVTEPLPGETPPAWVLDTAAVTAGGTQSYTCAREPFSRCRSHEGSVGRPPAPSRLRWEPGSSRARRPARGPCRCGGSLLGPARQGHGGERLRKP